VEKHRTAGQTAHYYKIRRMRFECWIPKATNTYSEPEIVIALYGNNDFANAPQYLFVYTYIARHVEQLKSVSDIVKFSHLIVLLDACGCYSVI
jgi:hypothetical protein